MFPHTWCLWRQCRAPWWGEGQACLWGTPWAARPRRGHCAPHPTGRPLPGQTPPSAKRQSKTEHEIYHVVHILYCLQRLQLECELRETLKHIRITRMWTHSTHVTGTHRYTHTRCDLGGENILTGSPGPTCSVPILCQPAYSAIWPLALLRIKMGPLLSSKISIITKYCIWLSSISKCDYSLCLRFFLNKLCYRSKCCQEVAGQYRYFLKWEMVEI